MPEPQTTNKPANTGTNEQADTKEKADAPKNPGNSYKKDYDGNEITTLGKVVAGFFLALLTFFGCFFIVCYWPDRLPRPEEKFAPLYINDPFHVRLACIPDTCCPDSLDLYTGAVISTTPAPANDSPTLTSTSLVSATDSPITTASPAATSSPATTATTSSRPGITPGIESSKGKRAFRPDELIHINILLLILVGLGGFVGNMIHVATSFTTFVGAGKFKKSWLLWYCIKPFTAAALAIGIYFVFRGGFLNMSDGGASINLYGLMTISLFAGLFTDKATEKLKEVFEVLFRSKEERPDPLVSKFKIINISPLIIEKDKINKMTLAGEKLDTEKVKISINNEEITDIKTSAGTITFDYTIPSTLKDKKTLTVSVKDDKGKEHYTVDLTVKEPEIPTGEAKPVEPKPGSPAPDNKPATGEKEGSASEITKSTETKPGTGNTETDASESKDDDDDADKADEAAQPIIKG